ncbi:MAG: hypothetical protein WAU81_01330 [Candidatus Aminicenantales bacterium]
MEQLQAMIGWANGDQDAHLANAAKKQTLILMIFDDNFLHFYDILMIEFDTIDMKLFSESDFKAGDENIHSGDISPKENRPHFPACHFVAFAYRWLFKLEHFCQKA